MKQEWIPKKAENLAEELDDSDLPGFESFSRIRALLAQSRIPAMLEMVEEYEEAETPLLVFSAHKAPIKALENRSGWAIITGETSAEDRFDIVKRFQEGKLNGVGLTIGAGGVGLTLTRASNILFVDLDWKPSMNIQAEDRAHRIGTNADNILIKRMVVPITHLILIFKTFLSGSFRLLIELWKRVSSSVL